MIFTIIQVVLLILAAVVPNIVRTFRAGKLKAGFLSATSPSGYPWCDFINPSPRERNSQAYGSKGL